MATIPAMKILVLGGGGREHALAWKLSKSPRKPEIFCAPGNGGIAREYRCFEVQGGLGNPRGVDSALRLAKELEVDFTIVGPEAPLAMGIVDRFEAVGLKVFGPRLAAARLESSKCFAKDFLDRHEIPTAAFRSFDSASDARKFVQKIRLPVVIKADGLAEGKGAFIARERQEAMSVVDSLLVQRRLGEAGARIVIEDFLPGNEMSLLVLTDGKNYLTLETARDYKPVGDGDKGPNTGGMGSFSPLYQLDDPLLDLIQDQIVARTLSGLQEEDIRFQGLLYFGLMLTPDGPHVLEFNVRFGDPETQPVLMRMQSDLLDLLEATAEGKLEGAMVEWDSRPALCVVAASGGYPGAYQTGLPVSGVEEAESILSNGELKIFCAGLKEGKATPNGKPELLTAGGRVLGVTALGSDVEEARMRVYESISKIHFQNMIFRKDVGN